ncbi:hypothetical protein BJAS_P3482 [Bathymodiolus japonicus methanotrophic gill symbiont]|uniref:primase-helicase family protein n=1 Tax=Bathymodiolus japonicus methanotrophic gill symbiont TaxID=113269 RepID=UPI001B5BF118|nr:primase-helicase family protein [Bathymodiolus japonicus methanotrophic gill symbiont]GFO72945.1 hypothetical protein BJAS_P3482 [Bathymodiolus japonicus methanotrophic gill symbiont]
MKTGEEELDSQDNHVDEMLKKQLREVIVSKGNHRSKKLNKASALSFQYLYVNGREDLYEVCRNELLVVAKEVGLSDEQSITSIDCAFLTKEDTDMKPYERPASNNLATVTNINKDLDIVKKTYKELDKYVKRYVHIQKGDGVFDLEMPAHESLCSLKEFNSSRANETLFTNDENGKGKFHDLSKLWLKHEDRLSARGVRYYPGKERMYEHEGIQWVNNFHMPELKEDKGTDKLDIFFNRMKLLFPDKKDREWFIGWMAYTIQFPYKRCKVTPLHISSNHGTGRGWLLECLSAIIGSRNIKKTKLSVLSGDGSAGQFQDFFHESILCAIEEVREEGAKQYAVSDKIRDYLTENTLEVNRKYGGKDTVDVFTNFFFMSNHHDAIVLTEEDRRINVFDTDCPKMTVEVTNIHYDWIKTGGINQLNTYLRGLDLKDFNFQTSIHNESRARLIGNSTSEAQENYNDIINDIPVESFTLKQLVRLIDIYSDNDSFNGVKDNHVKKLLQADKSMFTTHKRPRIKSLSTRFWSKNEDKLGEELKKDYARMEIHISQVSSGIYQPKDDVEEENNYDF